MPNVPATFLVGEGKVRWTYADGVKCLFFCNVPSRMSTEGWLLLGTDYKNQ